MSSTPTASRLPVTPGVGRHGTGDQMDNFISPTGNFFMARVHIWSASRHGLQGDYFFSALARESHSAGTDVLRTVAVRKNFNLKEPHGVFAACLDAVQPKSSAMDNGELALLLLEQVEQGRNMTTENGGRKRAKGGGSKVAMLEERLRWIIQ